MLRTSSQLFVATLLSLLAFERVLGRNLPDGAQNDTVLKQI